MGAGSPGNHRNRGRGTGQTIAGHARRFGLGERQIIMFSQTVRYSKGSLSKQARHNTDYTEKKKSHRLH